MDYEKRYKEALERAREWYNDSHITIGLKGNLKDIFPELAESEDERIRKALIDYFDDANKSDENPLQSYGIQTDEVIAWLEKQGEQKSSIKMKTPEESLSIDSDTYNKIVDECIYDEQKPDDKVEIKFKIEKGKWYVCIKDLLDNYTNKAFFKGDTYLSTQDGSLMPSNSNIPFGVVCPDTYFREWTIKDAKDGDVLVTVDDEHPFIYKGCLDPNHPDSPVAYCGIDDGGDFWSGSNKFNQWWTDKKVQRATKEQCDTLFKAMADAGYTFDFEKKELKKIEPIPAWSEEDEKMINSSVTNLSELMHRYGKKYGNVGKCINWLKSLKDRIQPQKQWKPSEEQMKALAEALSLAKNCGEEGAFDLRTLHEQLEKL